MKMSGLKIAAALLLLFVSVFGYAQQNFTVKAFFPGLADGTKFEMIPSSTHKDEKPVATAVAKNGTFTLTGKLDGPRMFYVKITNTYSGFQLFAEPGNIVVKGKVDSIQKDSDVNLTFKDIKITGSKSNEAYLGKAEHRELLDKDYENYHTQNQAIIDKVNSAHDKKDTALEEQLIASAEYKKFAADEKAFFDKVEKVISKLILDNKNTWWGPFLLLDQFSYLRPEEKRFYEQFSTEAKNSYYGKLVHEHLYPISKIGKPAPSFGFEKINDKPVTFASVIKDKKYLVVDFWASWCGPCRKQLPALKAFYEEMKTKGVEIVSVSIDKKEADWQKALEEEKMPWPNFLDRESVSTEWGVKAIPAMFLLDADGKVVTENVGLDEIRKKITM